MKRELVRRLAIPAAAAAAAGSFAVLRSLDRPHFDAEELRTHAVHLLDTATGCYDFGDASLTVAARQERILGKERRIITIPIKDSSAHKLGQGEWSKPRVGEYTNLIRSYFYATYPVLKGKSLATPAPGLVRAAPDTTETSTAYNLELAVAIDTPGQRVANIYYAADAAMSTANQSTGGVQLITGERLCGQLGFTVGHDGSITDLHVLPPSEEVGKLQSREITADNSSPSQLT